MNVYEKLLARDPWTRTRYNKQGKRNRARPYIYLFLFIYLYFTNLFILFLRPLCKINSFFFTRCEKLFEIELYIHREIKSSRELDYSTIVFNFYLFLYFSRAKNVLLFFFFQILLLPNIYGKHIKHHLSQFLSRKFDPVPVKSLFACAYSSKFQSVPGQTTIGNTRIRATKASNSFERKEKSQKYFTIHILQSKNISLNKKIMYGDKNGGTFKDGDIDRSFKLDPLTNRDLEQ